MAPGTWLHTIRITFDPKSSTSEAALLAQYPSISPRIEMLSASEAPALCEPVLRSVPEWFGIESATLQYLQDTSRMPTWGAFVDSVPPRQGEGAVAGFLTINRHFPKSAEIHCIGVRKEFHGRGIGTALLLHVERHLQAQGIEFLQVKTMGPSKPNAEYALTLRFYESCGFVRIEEFVDLWPGIPALMLIKRL